MLTNTVQPFTIYTMKIDSVFTSCVYYVGMATVINVPFSIKPFPPFGHSKVFFVFFALLSDQFGDSMSTQCTNSMFSDKNVERKKRYRLFSSGYMCFKAIELNAAKVQRRKKRENGRTNIYFCLCVNKFFPTFCTVVALANRKISCVLNTGFFYLI